MSKGIIPKKVVVKKVKINLNLSEDMAKELALYSKFLEEDDMDYIVEELLKISLNKDKDFKEFKKNNKENIQEVIYKV